VPSLATDALVDSVGFFWIDLEHSNMSPDTLKGHLPAARARIVPAQVRVTGNCTHFVKPAPDAGAEGIVVAQVQGVEEVRQVVRDCRIHRWARAVSARAWRRC
jgi:2-keto-3-deoxy-L-rhamnonate aldolase RhmA